MAYTVTQNTTFLTVASIAQKIISFVYFTFVARQIGVGNTGQYFFAIAFTTIFTVIADFGLAPVLTREAAKYPDQSEVYANTVFWTKFIFGFAAYGLMVFSVYILDYSSQLKSLIYLSGVTMLFDNLQTTFYSIFRARKNLIYESIGVVASQFLTLVIGTIALLNRWPLYWLIIAYTIPSFLNLLYAGYFVNRVYKFSYRFIFNLFPPQGGIPLRRDNLLIFKSFISLALPFAAAGIIGRLYSYSDSIIMSKMLAPEHLGWWSVPYKITFAFQFIPIALSASVYPVMSALSLGAGREIGILFEKAWRYLFTIVFPLAFGLMALARPVIIKLYGLNYFPSIMVLRILLISLIFGYLSFITGALLNATNHQKIQTTLLLVALVINVGLNLILIPLLGITGAAISAVVSNIVLCSGGFYFARRWVTIDSRSIFKFAGRAFWPALLMSLAVYFLALRINFILVIPVGVLIYVGLLFLSGGMSKELVREAVGKIRNR